MSTAKGEFMNLTQIPAEWLRNNTAMGCEFGFGGLKGF
jgi:hypothetical protein